LGIANELWVKTRNSTGGSAAREAELTVTASAAAIKVGLVRRNKEKMPWFIVSLITFQKNPGGRMKRKSPQNARHLFPITLPTLA
jgi:hypothetical protein